MERAGAWDQGSRYYYIPKYLERDQFIPVYGLAAHSLTSLSHFVCFAFFNIDLSSWHHLACLHSTV
jgi:hypothetical protein